MLEGFEEDRRPVRKDKPVTRAEAWAEMPGEHSGKLTPEQLALVNRQPATYSGDMFTSDEEPGR